MKKVDENSLLFWFPKVKDLGIPVPRTEIVEVNFGDAYWQYIEEPLPKEMMEKIEQAAKQIGYPLFLRTDHLSGKHGGYKNEWTPYIKHKEDLASHISWLLDDSACAGILGLPIDAFILREFLELDWAFKAFHGMPIARERRYFIDEGKVSCHHPYWPEEAMHFWGRKKEPDNWKEKLRKLNNETEDEIRLLTAYAQKIATVLEGYWSIDFAQSKKGPWYLIDAALGEKSWHPECPYAPKEDRIK